uniref:cAMP-dependent protein kinase inhibitor gamma n=1 Tax=Varanus komodoensis TaxID=61221 RepID=A0A8D2L7C3_VARKO
MDTEPAYSDFISCDRSGRRNAVHELQGDATALKLEKLASTIVDISIAKEGELLFPQDKPELPRKQGQSSSCLLV